MRKVITLNLNGLADQDLKRTNLVALNKKKVCVAAFHFVVDQSVIDKNVITLK